MNPCRCGYYPNRDKCRCTTADIKRYLAKISEPLLDRMDLCVETGLPEFSLYEKKGETSKQIRERVERTHRTQKKRYRKENFSYNSELTPQTMKKYCVMGTAEKELLEFCDDNNLLFSSVTDEREAALPDCACVEDNCGFRGK